MARGGMANAILTLRSWAEAGTADYALSGVTYFTDDHLQAVLDRNREDIYDLKLAFAPRSNSDDELEYWDAYFSGGHWEEASGGSEVWIIQDSIGDEIGTANYTANYQAGHIRFTADQEGSARYLTARRYNMHRAAAEIWRQKAANVANRYDWDSDNHRMKPSQMQKHYLQMATYYERQGGATFRRMTRSDVNV